MFKRILNIDLNKFRKIRKPFDDNVINFISDFSKELKKLNKNNLTELYFLMNWCTKGNILKIKNSVNLSKEDRVGRGIVFHISPSNVPTNFFYSFLFGLLAGNSNIVRIPKQNFPEKIIILKAFKNISKKKIYKSIKDTNIFIDYDHKDNQNITYNLSMICDVRMIWGGDKSINEIRKVFLPERSIELTFSDRYSISIINQDLIKFNNKNDLKIFIKKFFYDSFMMGQLACNSPQIIFWIGKKKSNIEKFWLELNSLVVERYKFKEIDIMDKYSNLVSKIISNNDFKKLKRYSNNIYVIDLDNKDYTNSKLRGSHGTFYQKPLRKLENVEKYIDKKCQTITYYGVSNLDIKNLIINKNIMGGDRIVPVGQSLNINNFWDGYDLIRTLSRVIYLN